MAIARALINKPAILMADEPTGNLDTANAEAIHNLFLSLRRDLKQTIILITHNEALAARTDRDTGHEGRCYCRGTQPSPGIGPQICLMELICTDAGVKF